MAARGLPTLGPTIFVQIAQAHERAGEADAARRALEEGKRAGLAVGPKALPDDERHAYFALVKRLAEDAHARGDFRAAAEDYQLYALYERAGLETYRTLADVYEQLGDALAALRVNEQALLYSAKDRDLLERRDKYYYSVMPEQLRDAPDQLKQAIDVGYCLQKARQLLDARDADWDLLDPGALQDGLERESFDILTRDDLVIGLAFAQMVLEGRVHPGVRQKALWAVERQMLDVVIAFRGWADPGERKRRLEHLRGVLARDWS
jgi:tetratricopeptide (TPR) repeat protein